MRRRHTLHTARTHLTVKWEVVEFEVLHEETSYSPSLEHERLAATVARRRQPRRLFRLAKNVLYVQQRIPVFI